MKIKIICVGNIKDNSLLTIFNNYLSKINHYIKIEYISIKEEKVNNENDASEIALAIKKEADKIKEKIEPNSFSFINAIEGKQYDSVAFAKLIDSHISNSIYKSINFIIGSSYGIDNSIKTMNNSTLLSFSKMTFPHQLFQVILLEQIYRSFTILKNIKYHK